MKSSTLLNMIMNQSKDKLATEKQQQLGEKKKKKSNLAMK